MLLDNPDGNYRFASGRGMPFSSGAIADPGFALVHASFNPLVRLSDGYGAIERHLREAARPLNAICGIELRIPRRSLSRDSMNSIAHISSASRRGV